MITATVSLLAPVWDAGMDSGRFGSVPLCLLDLAPTCATKANTSSVLFVLAA